MKWPIDWFLDGLFGAADHCVIVEDGIYAAVPQALAAENEGTIVAKGLRLGAARKMARRLRQQAEDQPRALLTPTDT